MCNKITFIVTKVSVVVLFFFAYGTAAPARVLTPVAVPMVTSVAAATPLPVPSYEAATINIVVGYSPGGGYDVTTRIVARHLSRHIPGQPRIIVQNMPGGLSRLAANYLFNVARPDGTVIGVIGPGLVRQFLIDRTGIEFDPAKFHWLTALSTGDVVACMVRTDRGVNSIEDAKGRKEPIVLGSTAPGGTTWDPPMLLNATVGTNLKIVTGYRGTAEINAAVMRGELDGACWSWASLRIMAKSMLEERSVKVFAQVGLKRHPDLKQVPNIMELAKVDYRGLLRIWVATQFGMERPFVAPPPVPSERVRVLRQAFDALVKDRDFIKDMDKARLDLSPISGELVQQTVREVLGASPADVQQLRKVLAVE